MPENAQSDVDAPSNPSRRDILGKAAVGGAIAWATPMVLASPASASDGSGHPECESNQELRVFAVKIQHEREQDITPASGPPIAFGYAPTKNCPEPGPDESSGYYYEIRPIGQPGSSGTCLSDAELASSGHPLATEEQIAQFAQDIVVVALDAEECADNFEAQKTAMDYLELLLPQHCSTTDLIGEQKLGSDDGCTPADHVIAPRTIIFERDPGGGPSGEKASSHVEIAVVCCANVDGTA